jgi:hypothetical protein
VIAYGILAVLQQAALPDRREWRGPGRRVLLAVGIALVLAAASLLAPQDLTWNIVRVVGVVACMPWFFRRLQLARGGSA